MLGGKKARRTITKAIGSQCRFCGRAGAHRRDLGQHENGAGQWTLCARQAVNGLRVVRALEDNNVRCRAAPQGIDGAVGRRQADERKDVSPLYRAMFGSSFQVQRNRRHCRCAMFVSNVRIEGCIPAIRNELAIRALLAPKQSVDPARTIGIGFDGQLPRTTLRAKSGYLPQNAPGRCQSI